MKNIGTNSIGVSELQKSDVFIGLAGNFNRASSLTSPVDADGKWAFILIDSNSNNQWDSGETLEIDAFSSLFTASGQSAYFQFVLPNGVYRSSEFTTS
jgi:flagellar protein FlaG